MSTALRITPDLAPRIHDAICRAVDQGLRITRPPESFTFGDKTYWTIDSVSTPGETYLVMIEQQPDGGVYSWCECAHNTLGREVCKHIGLALSEMGLVPRTEGT